MIGLRRVDLAHEGKSALPDQETTRQPPHPGAGQRLCQPVEVARVQGGVAPADEDEVALKHFPLYRPGRQQAGLEPVVGAEALQRVGRRKGLHNGCGRQSDVVVVAFDQLAGGDVEGGAGMFARQAGGADDLLHGRGLPQPGGAWGRLHPRADPLGRGAGTRAPCPRRAIGHRRTGAGGQKARDHGAPVELDPHAALGCDRGPARKPGRHARTKC